MPNWTSNTCPGMMSLEGQIKSRAQQLGFDATRITTAELPPATGDCLEQFVTLNRHGDMDWMAHHKQRRSSPQNLWPEARSAIIVAQNYGPGSNPMTRLQHKARANISVYAQNRDYHQLIKGRLKTLAQWLVATTGEAVKVFVDTAPLMEKPLAQAAGLGWQGKHTNLVSRDFGSWIFLGVILSAAALDIDTGESDHCGQCRACLDICPTDAFPAPYQLDARRCISYLTIEHKGHIEREFRTAMGNRIFGCDDCLAVCPWNKFAQRTKELKLTARPEIAELALAELLSFDDATFRRFFSGSPVKRSGRSRILRNALIAAGNSGDEELKPLVIGLLRDPSALIRAMAVWALAQLANVDEFDFHRRKTAAQERDEAVAGEWIGGNG